MYLCCSSFRLRNHSQFIPEWFFGIMVSMIVEETMGAIGAEQRRKVFRAWCKENHIFSGSVVERAIYYRGKEYPQSYSLTEDEEIDQACQYNIQSEYVEWKDIVRDGKIVGMDIWNKYEKTRVRYILPEYRNRGRLRKRLSKGSVGNFVSKMGKYLTLK